VSNLTINGLPSVQSLSPTSGSIYGGTLLTINGNGFDIAQNLKVSIGGSNCIIQSVILSKIVCLTSSHIEGNATVTITNSNNENFPFSTFYYNKFSSPNVTQISPKSGSAGQSITINGFGFGSLIGNI
jgi:hypothetical protein